MKKILYILMFIILSCVLSFCFTACQDNSEDDDTTPKKYTVHFDVNTEYETNNVLDQLVKSGMHAKKPTVEITDSSVTNYIVSGWYQDKELTQEWNFRKYKIEKDITLYAKWCYQYNVNYYLSDLDSPYYSCTAMEGELIEEHPEYAVGFKYYGSFADKDYTTPFDFTKPLTSDTNIYIKKSDEINFYNESESGNLYDNLEVFAAGSDVVNGIISKVGWVEKKTVSSGETYTYVNFGYSPYNSDPYVELSLPLDITSSEILRFTFKNLGYSTKFELFFTAFIDDDLNEYSATGKYYSAVYSKSASLSKVCMDENDDEWIVVEFDLSDVYSNGYSVWGTSKYLGGLRIQSTYKSSSDKDYSNAYLIKSIEGIKKDVSVEDSSVVQEEKVSDDAGDIESAGNNQEAVSGFIFPKDNRTVTKTSDFEVYEKTDSIALYSKNEIELRNTEYKYSEVEFTYPSDRGTVDLANLCTLNIRLRNYGYSDSISVYIVNEEDIETLTTINIGTRMEEFTTFFVNLSSAKYMKGNLKSVRIQYTSLGVDNLLEIESIYFSKFRPNDICGINFNDRYLYGFETVDGEVEVEYAKNYNSIKFSVLKDGGTIEVNKDYSITNDGFCSATLKYYTPTETNITGVTVYYKISDNYYGYEYSVDNTVTSKKAIQSTVNFNPQERGDINGLKIVFKGTGDIYLSSITFNGDKENFVDFTKDQTTVYDDYDWDANCKYVYDTTSTSSEIIVNKGTECTLRYYIGFIASTKTSTSWYPSTNISLNGKSTVKLIYQNRSESDKLKFTLGLDTTESGYGETGTLQVEFDKEIESSMDEYSWSVLTVDIPEEYTATQDDLSYYLGRFVLNFKGTMYIRGIVVE